MFRTGGAETMSMLVRRPSPYDELLSLRQAMDRLFDNDFTGPFVRLASGDRRLGQMPLDVRTDAESLTIEASLPGIRPEDVDNTIEGGTLTLSTKTEEERTEEEGSYLVREIRRGAVSRSVALPDGLEADQATATFAPARDGTADHGSRPYDPGADGEDPRPHEAADGLRRRAR
jgi:HSP20 family protein